jgi:PHS family inorganic phosphate transporter-like MFS transporter
VEERVHELLDRRFYGINLNQNVVLQQIGYAGTTGTAWEKLFTISTGNIIITVLGFVPGRCLALIISMVSDWKCFSWLGYYVTLLTIEKLGRKVIQFQGFLMAALFRRSFLERLV